MATTKIPASAARTYQACLVVGPKFKFSVQHADANSFTVVFRDSLVFGVDYSMVVTPDKADSCTLTVNHAKFGSILANITCSNLANAVKKAVKKIPEPSQAASQATSTPSNLGSELEKIQSLLSSGVLTQDEFDKAKARLLG